MKQPTVVIASTRPSPLLYKISSAAAKLDVSVATIYRLVARGDLEMVKIGARGSRITSESVARLAANGNQPD